MMKIGIDLDNTIINYDKAFNVASLAVLNKKFSNKKSLKKNLNSKKNGSKKWMRIQGLVYGKHINHAEIYNGFLNFLIRSNFNKTNLYIVSHKTKYGHFDKTKTNLRDSAERFLVSKNILHRKNNKGFINASNIFFCETKLDKISKINELKLDYFIDDLKDILKHPYIDKKMVKINFQGRGSKNIIAIDNWNLINNFIYGKEKKEDFFNYVRYANSNVSKIVKLKNGNNSCGFKVIINKQVYFLKYYNILSNLDYKRQEAEIIGYNYYKKNRIDYILKVYQVNFQQNYSIFSYQNFAAIKRVTTSQVLDALQIMKSIINIRKNHTFNNLPYASDSTVKIQNVNRDIKRKIDLIKKRNVNKQVNLLISKIDNKFNRFIKNLSSKEIKEISKRLNKKHLIASPSDFGFHNIMYDKNGKIYFFDFEYFGIDDPCKLVVDFFYNPHTPLNINQRDIWLSESIKLFSEFPNFKLRVNLLLVILGFKWILIFIGLIFKLNKVEDQLFCKKQIFKSLKMLKFIEFLEKKGSYVI